MFLLRLNLSCLVFFLISVLCCPACTAGDTPQLRDEINENNVLKEAVNKDREMINKIVLQNQPPRQPGPAVKDVEFEISGNQIMGSENARLIIVQFSDYSCGHCAFHTRETLPDIEKHYIDTGKLRYVVIDCPYQGDLISFAAAEAAHCAAAQGKFWEMHEEIMSDQSKIIDISSIASSVNLDMVDFRVCMEIKTYAGTVMKNIALADKLGIPTVPGFVIGKVNPDNPEKVKGISYIRGAKPFAVFQEAIEKALAEIAE